MTENELITLEQIHKEYATSIWDTCSLSCHLNGKESNCKSTQDGVELAKFLIEKIPQYNLFIPESVRDEYKDCWRKEKKNLIKEFEKNNRVLETASPLGQRVKFCDKYFQEFNKKYGIHRTDLRIFSWAIGLGNYFGSAAIISNDLNGMSKFWNRLINCHCIDTRRLGFFPRRELDSYERFRSRKR